MPQIKFKNNDDLVEYLGRLAGQLKMKGKKDLVEGVMAASEAINGSPIEFLEEAEAILKKVKRTPGITFSRDEAANLNNAIEQIEVASKEMNES